MNIEGNMEWFLSTSSGFNWLTGEVTAHQHFYWEKTVKQYEVLYYNVLKLPIKSGTDLSNSYSRQA